MEINLVGTLSVCRTMGYKPNYSELSRQFGVYRHTISKIWKGVERKLRKPKVSQLDQYKDEIEDRLKQPGVRIKSVYWYFKNEFQIKCSYDNFKYYVRKNKLFNKSNRIAHVLYETDPGNQLQADWVENISLETIDGEIIFGITNDYNVIGIAKPKDECLNIENQINDSIKPRPDYTLRVDDDKTITLYVRKGSNTPYRYNGKAYKRNDSSTIEVDSVEENRLVLERMNLNFEELNANEEELKFEYLGNHLKSAMDLSDFNLDTLKSLNLFNTKNGYNNAAKLLADINNMPGLDIAVFGNSINIFKKRVTLSGKSILKQYYDALEVYKNEYVVEKIEDGFRKKYELIPFDAYREAVANALVHRTWDINANTKIEMHPDKIVVSSPGGLMTDMTKEDFMSGNYSSLRNPIIANVFRRMNIIEAFATGIKRINEAYINVIVKPIFNVTSSAISVTLPVIDQVNLSNNEKKVLESMKQNYSYSRLEIEKNSGFAKDTLIRILNSLVEKGLIEKGGKAKATFYIKK